MLIGLQLIGFRSNKVLFPSLSLPSLFIQVVSEKLLRDLVAILSAFVGSNVYPYTKESINLNLGCLADMSFHQPLQQETLSHCRK